MKVFFYSIVLSGETYKIYTKSCLTLSDMITFFNYGNQLNILEFNGQIYTKLNKQKIHQKYLQNKDQLEIITIVGGG
uniref:hypothetical protein n=1 Tax=Dictyotopsis propagulifera TaxID=670095 RepID=UPI002E785D90|nr:hypothetical protein V2485_pgp006 [Dictyotopsis propagulifera]WAM63251.1 hypothetical protein [Dictyotopsis propagulifera]